MPRRKPDHKEGLTLNSKPALPYRGGDLFGVISYAFRVVSWEISLLNKGYDPRSNTKRERTNTNQIVTLTVRLLPATAKLWRAQTILSVGSWFHRNPSVGTVELIHLPLNPHQLRLVHKDHLIHANFNPRDAL